MTAREIRGEDRRADILAAALEEFAAHGYRGTSLAAIGARVGLTQQGVLHHFPTKQQVLIAALEERERQDTEWWLNIYESEDVDFLDLMVRLLEHTVGRAQQSRLMAVLGGDSLTAGHPAHEFFRRRYATLRSSVAEALRLAEERRGVPLPSSTVALAVLDGLQLQWLLEPEAVDMAEEFRSFVTLLRADRGVDNGQHDPDPTRSEDEQPPEVA